MQHFQKGSGTFSCRICGRLTRLVSGDDVGLGLCALDIEVAMAEAAFDNGRPINWPHISGLIGQIAQAGGKISHWDSFAASVTHASGVPA